MGQLNDQAVNRKVVNRKIVNHKVVNRKQEDFRQGHFKATACGMLMAGVLIGSALMISTPAVQGGEPTSNTPELVTPELETPELVTGAITYHEDSINPILQLPPAPEDGLPAQAPPKPAAPRSAFLPDFTPPKTARPDGVLRPQVRTPDLLPKIKSESLQQAARRLKLPLPLPRARIVVKKSERRLYLYSGSTLVKIYRVALGPNPDGHKQRSGDGRTPEGQYYICTRNNRNSAFHIFLGLSYPAIPDATRGVNNNQITWREYQVIRQRLASRGAPLWETRLGGWVGIHGGSDGTYAKQKMRERNSPDWTAGCVALTNREIAELHAATSLGTPVLVMR